MTFTLRIFINGRQRLALPYRAEQNDEMAALLTEYWERLKGEGRRLGAVVEDGDGVMHLIGRAK